MNRTGFAVSLTWKSSDGDLAQNTAQDQPERVSVRFSGNAVNRELTLNG